MSTTESMFTQPHDMTIITYGHCKSKTVAQKSRKRYDTLPRHIWSILDATSLEVGTWTADADRTYCLVSAKNIMLSASLLTNELIVAYSSVGKWSLAIIFPLKSTIAYVVSSKPISTPTTRSFIFVVYIEHLTLVITITKVRFLTITTKFSIKKITFLSHF